jgi:hypothetical protein
MFESGARVGDPLVICDICGFRYPMSATRKTWDGLRVCRKDWDPKHPQLTIKGIPDRQAVYDGRPEPPDQFVDSGNFGSFCLQSSNGTNYIVSMADGGTLTITAGVLGTPALFLQIGSYLITVTNAGTLQTTAALISGPAWQMHSPDNTAYRVTAPGGTITVGLW